MPSAGVVTITFTGNIKPLAGAVSRAEGRLLAFQRRINGLVRSVQAAGKKIATVFGIVSVVAAGMAAKIATEFDKSVTKIQTLVGVAGKQVDEFRRGILELAPRVGRGPRELADAMFAVTSAGQRGANAMRILESAAKASAVGLGNTRDVALAVTAAINAYGEANLSAARAADIMFATIREGNLEPAELASSLGRVIGIASSAGVTFEEVGAFIATMTRQGVDAREAVTALRNILKLILQPTKKQRDALDELGSSVEAVRRSVAERGLAATLGDLASKFKENRTAVSAAAGRLRALVGFLATAVTQGETYAGIVDSINKSTGDLQKGFETFRETPAASFEELTARAEALAIKIGDVLAPAFSKLLAAMEPIFENVTQAVEAFSELDPRLIAAAVAGIALTGVTAALAAALAALISPMGAVAAGFAAFASLAGLAVSRSDRFKDAFRTSSEAAQRLERDLDDLTGAVKDLSLEQQKSVLSSLAGQLSSIQVEAVRTRQKLEDELAKGARNSFLRVGDGIESVFFGAASPAASFLAGTMSETSEEAEKLRERLKDLEEQSDAVRTAQNRVAEAMRNVNQEDPDAKDIFEGGGGTGEIDDTTKALQELREAMLEIKDRKLIFGDDFDEFEARAKAMESAIDSLLERRAELQRLIESGSDENAKALRDELVRNSAAVDALAQRYKVLVAQQRAVERSQERISDAMSRFRDLMEDAETPAEKLKDALEELNFLLAIGAIGFDEFVRAATEALRRFNEAVESTDEVVEQAFKEGVVRIVEDATNAIADALTDIVIGTKNVKEAFKDMVESLLREVNRLVFRILFLKKIKPILEDIFNVGGSNNAVGGGGGAGGLIGGLIGGIVSGLGGGGGGGAGGPGSFPTFQHGGRLGHGRLGIVGETGPELVRGPAFVRPNAEASGRIVIHNENNFNVNAIDQRGVSDFIRENRETIAAETAQTISRSVGLQRQLLK